MNPTHLSEAPTPFERLLLDAARGERPDATLEQRMLAPVALAAALSTLAHSPVPHVAHPAWLGWGKWGMGLISAGALGLFVTNAFVAARPTPVDANAREPAPRTTPLANPKLDLEGNAPHGPSVREQPAAAAAGAGAAASRGSERTSPPSMAPARTAGDPLHDELVLLERARQALAQGQAKSALAVLHTYDARHPSGQLAQEAIVLRVQALEARGETREADQLAERFLQRNPASAHAPRIERSTQGSKSAVADPLEKN